MIDTAPMIDTATVPFTDLHPRLSDFHGEALEGLTATPKRISPKFFYDKRGSELFDRITRLPEYYPTRTETGILERRAPEIADRLGDDCLLIEYGSGSSRKIRVLLDALRGRRVRYVAIDISKQHLLESAEALAEAYPETAVSAVCADYTQPIELPAETLAGVQRRVVFFPGSTIGNFAPGQARAFLRRTAELAGPGGGLLIGVDLKKDKAVLDAAYDDAEGVTAEFNLNLLRRMNRELSADFDIEAFAHRAFYNAEAGRIEMHLVSLRDQTVRVDGREIRFQTGETIHTESSYKFAVEEFQALAAECGFRPETVWTDENGLFSVHCMTVEPLSGAGSGGS